MDLRLTLTFLAWLALLGMALAPLLRKVEFTERQGWLHFAAFGLTLGVFLLLARWSSLTFPGEFNMDESTNIAFGLKYLQDPIPWRSVDGVTCGPLSAWVNLWAPLVGLKLSYFVPRLTVLILILAALLATALSAREMVGPKYALFCVFPAATLLGTTLHPDFVTAALEYLPVAMTSGVIFLILSDYRAPCALKVFFVGLITGAISFTKLQAAPSAVALFLICAGLLVTTRRATRNILWRHSGWLALGGLTIPTLILVPVTIAGAGPEFVDFYLLCGASYQGQPVRSTPDFLLSGNGDFGVYGVASLAASTLFLGFVQKRAALREWWGGAGLLAAYAGITLYAVLKPGFHFTHYLIFLVTPTTLLMAWVLRAFLTFPNAFSAPRRTLIVGIAFGLLTVAQAENAFLQYSQEGARPADWRLDDSPLLPAVSKYATPGGSMAIWGRVSKLYALTGMRPATRFADTAYVMDPSPGYDRHRRLFLQDLKRDRPRLFIDASDEIRWPTWPPGALAQHEMSPELADWIRREYTQAAEVKTGRSTLPVRIYVRKDP